LKLKYVIHVLFVLQLFTQRKFHRIALFYSHRIERNSKLSFQFSLSLCVFIGHSCYSHRVTLTFVTNTYYYILLAHDGAM